MDTHPARANMLLCDCCCNKLPWCEGSLQNTVDWVTWIQIIHSDFMAKCES